MDQTLLRDLVFSRLKLGSISGDDWEEYFCDATQADWIKGDKYLADGVWNDAVLNIKSLFLTPKNTKAVRRDFISHPNASVFNIQNQRIAQRRSNLPKNLDEQSSPPYRIGNAMIEDFDRFVKESHDKFNTNKVWDVIIRHGHCRDNCHYLVDVRIFDHKFLNSHEMQWEEVKQKTGRQAGQRIAIQGRKDDRIACRRNSANATYQCAYLILYKDLTEPMKHWSFKLPLPEESQFDRTQIAEEIKYLEEKIAKGEHGRRIPD